MKNADKILKRSIKHDDFINEYLKDSEAQKEYINESLSEYFADGDFDMFFKSLERVIKARDSVSSFAKKVNIDRTNLYAMFNGKKTPRLDTVAKILKELGFTIKVA